MTTLKELIAQHAADLGDDYPAIAARLNAPTSIPNPDAGKTNEVVSPVPVTLKSLLAVVCDLAEAKAVNYVCNTLRLRIDTPATHSHYLSEA